ncbi:uncharacterized protein LOC115685579 [Syzygium oleosum]|uniref:uncharacterized protein LOC115685579 n=1 Tax=Syzygium oleosum TaxID=219896 RepID=UPI0024BA788F|nr:uncharacterized protein LOC115685579 [Syzygium oleosum]
MAKELVAVAMVGNEMVTMAGEVAVAGEAATEGEGNRNRVAPSLIPDLSSLSWSQILRDLSGMTNFGPEMKWLILEKPWLKHGAQWTVPTTCAEGRLSLRAAPSIPFLGPIYRAPDDLVTDLKTTKRGFLPDWLFVAVWIVETGGALRGRGGGGNVAVGGIGGEGKDGGVAAGGCGGRGGDGGTGKGNKDGCGVRPGSGGKGNGGGGVNPNVGGKGIGGSGGRGGRDGSGGNGGTRKGNEGSGGGGGIINPGTGGEVVEGGGRAIADSEIDDQGVTVVDIRMLLEGKDLDGM